MSRPPLPPFAAETAAQKARRAEDVARALAERDERIAELEAELKRLRRIGSAR